MPLKLAIKRLTASDLTFFATQFRQNPSVKQKAINLNADVFVDKLYPGLSDPSAPRLLKVNIAIYGPGLEGKNNLVRKIVKSERSKNWRLNGELVHNPDVNNTRFDSLRPGDFAVFGFSEGMIPTSLDAILIAKEAVEDQSIHTFLDQFLGTTRMLALSPSELEKLVVRAYPLKEHPIYKLTLDTGTLDSNLEDIALGGSQGREKLLLRPSSRKISHEDLQRAKEMANYIGRYGEQFVNEYLTRLHEQGKIRNFEWVSDENSISPYDFRINEETSVILVDVKSTQGEFKRELHVSLNELRRMTSGPERYDIYRVSDIKEGIAQLRIAKDVKKFAKSVLEAFEHLPSGVFSDSISFTPTLLSFEDPLTIELSELTEEEEMKKR